MALVTIGSIMGADKRKSASLVELIDVLHDPRFRGMATAAVGANRLLVHVGMAGGTLLFRFAEHQGEVALAAVGCLMPSRKRECCGIMVEGIDRSVKLPAAC